MFEMLISSLDLRNLIHVFETDGANDLVAGAASTFLNTGRFLEEIRSRRCLRDKRERTVWLNGYEGRGRDSRLKVCRSSIELLTEVHRLDTASTERGADWWCRGGFACGDQDALEQIRMMTVVSNSKYTPQPVLSH